MNRWNFISGLTVILLLILVLSGYCVWVSRTMTGDLQEMMAGNYDTIRSLREMRTAITHNNARYLSSRSFTTAALSRGTYEVEKSRIEEALAAVRRGADMHGETVLIARLETLTGEYFTNYDKFFQLEEGDQTRFTELLQALARGSVDIGEQAQGIVDLNERSMFARRDAAVQRGRRFGWAALGIAALSLAVYCYTSVRLTRAVFVPLRQLRDSIVKVRHRRFDLVVPIRASGELDQIASTFNEMAAELRSYVAETDQRVVEANRLSRAILEALPYPIYIVDGAFNVKLKNPSAVALSGALMISGQLPGAVRKCIDQAAALGCELVGDDLNRAVEIPLPGAAAGPTPTYLPQVFRMADVPGSTNGWAVLLMDVTKLRHFDRAKTKAIATLGHEVKTPVTSIRMTLHLLLEEKIGALTDDQRELVAAGRDDCERLLTVLHALLELARFEAGRVEVQPVPTPTADLLAQAEAMHGGAFRGSASPFAVEPVATGLPRVHADSIHVVRVLGNFLSNAAKYRTPGTAVTLRAEERADGFVRLSVRNRTPRPLTEAEQARVFDPFYRRAGEGAEGTGLGLTICREIATAHGGRVGVWSKDDEVEFYFDLRAAAPAEATAVPVPLLAPTRAGDVAS